MSGKLIHLTKMNTAQVIACLPGIYVKNISQLHQIHSKPCVLPMSPGHCSCISLSLRAKSSLGLKYRSNSKSWEPLYICFAGGKGMMENSNENSPWKSLEKAMEKFKGQSIEEVLRQQINKGEYYDGGGSGAKPPGGGRGGDSGPDDPNPGGSEDESFAGMLDDNIQMILATLGFIFLYIYILNGAELTKLARDYIKYLFGGNQSVRLRNAMYEWGLFYQSLTEKEEVDKYWLEKAILNTPTWWHNPDDYRVVVRNYLEAHPEVNILDSDSDDESD